MNRRQKEVINKHIDNEKQVMNDLKNVYEQALKDVKEKIAVFMVDPDMQSKIYQAKYQEQLKLQLESALDKLKSGQYDTLQSYLNDCYTDGYIGAMYDMHGQGVPIITPIDPEEVLRAVELDSKISEGLYTSLGHDVTALKIRIAGEVSRGIATALTYEEVARNLREQSRIPLNRARTIARTEGHRIQQASAHNAKIDAKQAGADVLKQWDATLDGDTRPEHRELDGQIKEVDEPFETESGLQAMYPGAFGKPEQDCNCRCASLQRARWALDVKELQVLKNRAEYFGLDKADSFEGFKSKYIDVPEHVQSGAHNIKTLEKSRKSSKIQSRQIILSQEEIIEKATDFGNELLNNLSLIKYDNGEPISNYINQKIGYNGLPRVVPASEFDVLSEDKQVLYRGVTDYKGLSAQEMVEQFKRGSFYCGRGVYGNGTYVDTDKKVAMHYAYGSKDTNNGQIMEMLLADDAKTVSYLDIFQEWEETGIYKIRGDQREAYQDVIGDVGVYAAIKGYDAIMLDGWQGKNHVVILNRSKVIIRE